MTNSELSAIFSMQFIKFGHHYSLMPTVVDAKHKIRINQLNI